MSVIRINEFVAREGSGDALQDLISSSLPMIESSPGCLSCRLLRGRENPARVVVIEEWESVEAHQAATAAIPQEALGEAMKLLAGPPRGAYYDS